MKELSGWLEIVFCVRFIVGMSFRNEFKVRNESSFYAQLSLLLSFFFFFFSFFFLPQFFFFFFFFFILVDCTNYDVISKFVSNWFLQLLWEIMKAYYGGGEVFRISTRYFSTSFYLIF